MNNRYAAIEENDYLNGENVCVSFWVQGCPHKCAGCHNPETWDFKGGKELPLDYKGQIVKAISANNITRNFSVLGGEPLCNENLELTESIISTVRAAYPHIKIYLWTGYHIDELTEEPEPLLDSILGKVDIVIDGKFIQEQRDITLKLRGSANQRILQRGVDF